MSVPFNLSGKLNLLNSTFYFFKIHWRIILVLGFIAALGRVIQLGGFGPVPAWMNMVLEVVVESARIFLFLYVLGIANIKNGVLRIKQVLTHTKNGKMLFFIAIQKLKKQWFLVMLNLVGFLLIVWTINYLIDLLAYHTCLYLTLKKAGILAVSSSEWTILLFFKNLTIIPLTLIFDALLLLWLSNKLLNYKKVSLV